MRRGFSPALDDPENHPYKHAIPPHNTTPPRSLRASISPPPSRTRRTKPFPTSNNNNEPEPSPPHYIEPQTPTLAAIEAGRAQIQNHLEYFSTLLSHHASSTSRLSIPSFKDLYRPNEHPHGRHFVIHQHDHPVAGLHYDLRLQINETSSISWAVMYGVPGNPNSRRLSRNATETRVHNVWVGGY